MRQWISFISAFLFMSAAQASSAASCRFFDTGAVTVGPALPLNHYTVHYQACRKNQKSWWSLREFTSRGQRFLFGVDVASLQTEIISADCVDCSEASLSQLPTSRYKTLLQTQSALTDGLMNKDFTRSPASQKYFLSVDLCPSRKPFDKSIFDNVKIASTTEFPVAIALSGGWMSHNLDVLSTLKSRVLSDQLKVVWVNHSYTHPYHPGVPNAQNFLLSPHVRFDDEILKQEQYMISNGVTPSIFFRFPGLVSDKELRDRLLAYGLIPLGADAWLALGQKAKPGSIILIHGNGNEPYGVRLFLHFLENLSDLAVFQSLNLAP
jgi:hypothetical protein